MNHSSLDFETNRRLSGTTIAGSAFLIVAVLVLRAQVTEMFDGRLFDADSYMWLTRVLHLHETGDWFNQHLSPERSWGSPVEA